MKLPPPTSPQSREERQSFAADDKSPRAVINRFNAIAYDQRNPARALELFLAPDFIQRSPIFQMQEEGLSDREAALAFFEANGWKEGEGNCSTIYKVLVDGNEVAVFHHMQQQDGDPGYAFVDMYRVEDGLIVEHWAVSMPVPDSIDPRHPIF